MNFQNKRAIVTGAGKGIGRDIALLLAQRGASVVAVSRTPGDLDSLRAETNCDIVCADLPDAQETARAAQSALRFWAGRFSGQQRGHFGSAKRFGNRPGIVG